MKRPLFSALAIASLCFGIAVLSNAINLESEGQDRWAVIFSFGLVMFCVGVLSAGSRDDADADHVTVEERIDTSARAVPAAPGSSRTAGMQKVPTASVSVGSGAAVPEALRGAKDNGRARPFFSGSAFDDRSDSFDPWGPDADGARTPDDNPVAANDTPVAANDTALGADNTPFTPGDTAFTPGDTAVAGGDGPAAEPDVLATRSDKSATTGERNERDRRALSRSEYDRRQAPNDTPPAPLRESASSAPHDAATPAAADFDEDQVVESLFGRPVEALDLREGPQESAAAADPAAVEPAAAVDEEDRIAAALVELQGYSEQELVATVKHTETTVIRTMMERGQLSTEGPITDQDVAMMVFLSCTTDELLDDLRTRKTQAENELPQGDLSVRQA